VQVRELAPSEVDEIPAKSPTADDFIMSNLLTVRDQAHPVALDRESRLVVFSDLHMGDGGSRDDFLPNSDLFLTALRDYYIPEGFTVVLNGDIEELQRFSLRRIRTAWNEVYRRLEWLQSEGRLYKIYGNHDIDLLLHQPTDSILPVYPAVKLDLAGKQLLLFHGHQASRFFEKYNHVSGFFLRYFATPLGIKNSSTSHDSNKQYLTERRVYDFARRTKSLCIIGHTHRPLFESLSKIDSLRFRIEGLCRNYPMASDDERRHIESSLSRYKQELDYLLRKDRKNGLRSSLYNSGVLVPCLFNSGCTIGKRGMTGLEITDNTIRLVHWFDQRVSRKYFRYNGYEPNQLTDTDYYRTIINEDCLDYIFTRITLLT
jgi:predicted phosphodiesterase